MKECPHLTHLTCLGLIQRFYPPLPLEIRPHLKEVVIGGTELTAADLERYGPVLQYKYTIAFFSFSSLFGFYREGHVVLCYSIYFCPFREEFAFARLYSQLIVNLLSFNQFC